MWWLDYQLNKCGVPASGLYDKPQAPCDVTWGLVEGFKVWMLQQGYAIASIPQCPCDISKLHTLPTQELPESKERKP